MVYGFSFNLLFLCFIRNDTGEVNDYRFKVSSTFKRWLQRQIVEGLRIENEVGWWTGWDKTFHFESSWDWRYYFARNSMSSDLKFGFNEICWHYPLCLHLTKECCLYDRDFVPVQFVRVKVTLLSFPAKEYFFCYRCKILLKWNVCSGKLKCFVTNMDSNVSVPYKIIT